MGDASKEVEGRFFYCLHCTAIVSGADLCPDDIADQSCPMPGCNGGGVGTDLHDIDGDFAQEIISGRGHGRDCRSNPLSPAEREAWVHDKALEDNEKWLASERRADSQAKRAKWLTRKSSHGRGHKR